MTSEYRKSVDELARRRKSHPHSLPAYGAQSRAQLRTQALAKERRTMRRALIVVVIAVLVIGFAAYRVMKAVTP